MCAGMLSTRTTHLTWKAARASLCWSAQLWGQGPMNQMSQLQLPHQSCFGMRVYLSVAYSNKGSGLAVLFRQDPSTIVGLRGWPPAPTQAVLRCRKMWKLTFPFTACRSDQLLRKDGQVPLPHFYVSVDSFLRVNIYVQGLYGAQSFYFYTESSMKSPVFFCFFFKFASVLGSCFNMLALFGRGQGSLWRTGGPMH